MSEMQNDEQPGFERDLLKRLAFASINEQRRARRWGIFFKLMGFAYLSLILYLTVQSPYLDDGGISDEEHTAKIHIDGLISDASEANAEAIIRGLRGAFEDVNTKGIVLRINSPGGSPVQADQVYREIRRLRAQYENIPVYAVIMDVGASGAYYIAAATDKIYVNPSSIVGSIGVLMNGFGFVEGMDKLGIERRLMTAGDHKAVLDPFLPLKDNEVEHVQGLLDDIHQRFIQAVKEGRGERLTDNTQLFSGLFWTGEESIDLGLSDAVGDVDYVAREVIGEESIKDFTSKPDVWERLAHRIGASFARVLGEQGGLSAGGLR